MVKPSSSVLEDTLCKIARKIPLYFKICHSHVNVITSSQRPLDCREFLQFVPPFPLTFQKTTVCFVTVASIQAYNSRSNHTTSSTMKSIAALSLVVASASAFAPSGSSQSSSSTRLSESKVGVSIVHGLSLLDVYRGATFVFAL